MDNKYLFFQKKLLFYFQKKVLFYFQNKTQSQLFLNFQSNHLQVVLQLVNVKLSEGLIGIWISFLPQYLIKAMLLGEHHVDSPCRFLTFLSLKMNLSDINLKP